MSDLVAGRASRDADAAARRAGVVVREVSDLAGLAAVGALFTTIWGKPSVSTELLRAFSKTESYVAGAFRDGALVGACVAFHAAPRQRALHSHIAGVTPGTGGRGVGYAIKLHQRAWALDLGIDEISWTYDPLVARNAHFNINKLGARPAEYLTNFYGPMSDAINGDEDTDRVLVRWDLRAPEVVAACGRGGRGLVAVPDVGAAGTGVVDVSAAGFPPIDVMADGVWVAAGRLEAVVPVPPDIEGLRAADPAGAHEWRLRLRATLGPYLPPRFGGPDEVSTGPGRRVGYDRERGYLVHALTESAP